MLTPGFCSQTNVPTGSINSIENIINCVTISNDIIQEYADQKCQFVKLVRQQIQRSLCRQTQLRDELKNTQKKEEDLPKKTCCAETNTVCQNERVDKGTLTDCKGESSTKSFHPSDAGDVSRHENPAEAVDQSPSGDQNDLRTRLFDLKSKLIKFASTKLGILVLLILFLISLWVFLYVAVVSSAMCMRGQFCIPFIFKKGQRTKVF